MDPLDAAWQELTERLRAGSLGGVEATLAALEQSSLADDAGALERARGVLDSFGDLIHQDPAHALAESTLAVAVARARSEPLLTAELSRQRAAALFALGRSRDSLEATAAGLEALGPRSSEADAARARASLLGFRGNALLAQGRVRESLVALEEAIALARAQGLTAQLAVYLASLGNTRLFSGNPRSAEDYYEEALELARKHKNKEGQAVGLGNLGLVQFVLGDLEDAQDLFEQALGKAREIGDRRNSGTIEANIGAVLAQRGDLEGASRRFDVALALARQLGDKASEAVSLLRMAGVARERGALDHSETLLDQARAAFEGVHDPRQGAVQDERGRIALDNQDPAAARALFTSALETARALRDSSAEAVALYDLGRAALADGDRAAAKTLLDEAIELADELDSPRLRSFVRSALAELHAANADTAKATEALAGAGRYALPNDFVVGVRLTLARARSHAAEDPERARALLLRAIQETRKHGFNALAAEAQRRRDSLEKTP